jgi:acetyltransferase-like isoleucine patch superfamily enzyme
MKSWVLRRRGDVEMVYLRVASYLPVHLLRVAALRLWGAKIHPLATVYHGFEVRAARRLSIGARSSIGNGAILDARAGITIGSDVNLSTGVHIWTGQHDWRDADFGYDGRPVVIGDHAWVSTRVTVLPGTIIGEGAVVAAGAVVSGEVLPYTVVGGVPAKQIAERPSPMSYELPSRKQKQWWW